jgi:hypothetical protein
MSGFLGVKMLKISFKNKMLVSFLIFFVVIFLPIKIALNNANAGAIAVTGIFEIAKLIIKRAIPMGIKDACKRYFDNNWNWAKYVVSPVIDLFPKLLSSNSEERQIAANKAIAALDNDNNLRNKIHNRLKEVEQTQKEFAKKINELDLTIGLHKKRMALLKERQNSIEERQNSIEERQNSIIEKLDSGFTNSPEFFLSFSSILGELKFHQFGLDNIMGDRIGLSTSGILNISKVRLPGAYSCYIWDSHPYFRDSLTLNCDMTDWEGTVSPFHYIKTGFGSDEILSVDETLFIFTDCVRSVMHSLPKGWHIKYPLLWNFLKHDRYWNLYQKKIKNEAGFLHTYDLGKKDPLGYPRQDAEINTFKAFSPNKDQEVWVTYEMSKRPPQLKNVKIIFFVHNYIPPIRNMR